MTSKPDDAEDESAGPVFKAPDPDLDKLVEKEAPAYAAPKGKGTLGPIVPRFDGPRIAGDVASQIDSALNQKLMAAKIPASARADDAEFLRRVSIDLIGIAPTAARTRAFLAETLPDKRARLIDELLASPDFGQTFAHEWHDLLVKRDPDVNKAIRTHGLFVNWLGSQFNSNRPWDQTVRSMLTASGDQALVGETFFLLANSENAQPAANKIVGTAAALFLGNQLMCAECHVHPMTPEWKQSDFWGLAAFFGKIRAQRNNPGKRPMEVTARLTEEPPTAGKAKGKAKDAGNPKAPGLADGSIPIPDPRNDGKFIGTARPKLLEGDVLSKSSATRNYLANWFVSPKNPFFARATVNRMWAHFFARGFINPLDDIRPDSQATHPEVLDLLATELVTAQFDLKHMIRCICLTQAYQRSSRTLPENQNDEELFSHMAMKVLTPRALFRTLANATSNKLPVPAEPDAEGKRGENPNNEFVFFDVREYDENPGDYTYGVPQLLKLMNAKLPPACDAMGRSLASRSRDQAIEELYLLILARRPLDSEKQKLTALIAQEREPARGYSAVAWVLFNTAEFINNH